MPDRLAVVSQSRQWMYRGFTFGDFAAKTRDLAAGLAQRGLTAGARVGLLVPPGRGLFEAGFGLMRAGAVPVLIDAGIGRRRFGQCLDETEVDAVVGTPEALVACKAFGWARGATMIVAGIAPAPGVASLDEIARQGRSLMRSPVRFADLCAIVFTSGSTGPPKGVEYTQENLDAQVDMIERAYGIEPAMVNVATFAPFALLGPLLGMTTYLPKMDFANPGSVDPERVIRAANDANAAMLFGSPALLDTVSRFGQMTGARLRTITTVLSAGAPVPSAVMDRMLAMLPVGAEVHTPYGASEALPVTTISSRELSELAGQGVCVGRPVDGVDVTVIPIVEGPLGSVEEVGELAAGEVGEIVVRGRGVTRGYHGRPADDLRAKLTWAGQRAHRMGDLGTFDERGRLWYYGRKSHRIPTSEGEIYPVPVESIFNRHPAVRRSALVGVGRGHSLAPVLVVELEPGEPRPDPLDILAVGLADPVATKVRKVLFHPNLPTDIRHNSKIDRPVLADWAAEQLAKT